ncbi:hypothetical protein [Actinophytocola gossypii]|uniref:Uncharacterized protein n=1 Tax=Actinophytocola gossypii TaxID=2812003 RepID=A0ABT2JHF8_9PSEU|nr:hypothetical protein [Actinophytocola gossypii]MCT2586825.1 hypothetical protein [Actinophytocola gossypii]
MTTGTTTERTVIEHARRCVETVRTTIVGLGVFAFLAGLPLLVSTSERRTAEHRPTPTRQELT